MEQVCNFKLTRLEACAMGSPIGKVDGWPGSPTDEQDPVKVQKGPNEMGQEAPKVERGGQGEAFCVLKVCLLSANPSYGHLPQRSVCSSRCSPAHCPLIRHRSRKKPKRAGLLNTDLGRASMPWGQGLPDINKLRLCRKHSCA